jgi:hypothetical protein
MPPADVLVGCRGPGRVDDLDLSPPAYICFPSTTRGGVREQLKGGLEYLGLNQADLMFRSRMSGLPCLLLKMDKILSEVELEREKI